MARMTSLYIGVSGLQNSRNAINTTAHNLSNINTTGYVRQQVQFSDRTYSTVGNSATSAMQVGLGVDYQSTSRVRDILLDAAYRKENGRSGFYDAQYEAVMEIETVVGEIEGEQFQNIIENLWNSINEMAKTPDNMVSRSEFVMYSEEFLTRAKAIYTGLVEYQENLNTGVNNLVNQINEYGYQIKELNEKIAGIEGAQIEKANDYRDQRDLILDKLSEIVKISYDENANNIVTVKIEGIDFVTENTVFPMAVAELDKDRDSTYLSCVWPHLEGREVFFLEENISTANNNDIGQLKGYLLARGDYVATYKDIPHTKDYDLTTSEGKQAYNDAVATYNREVNPSSVMSMQAMLDTLVNGIVESINDILSPTINASFVAADGTVYDNVRVLDAENCSTGDNGELPPAEMFSRTYTDRYKEVVANDGTTYYVYNDKNIFGSETLYTLSELEMNKEVVEDYSKLPFTNREGEIDMKKGVDLLAKWDEPFAELNPDNLTPKTFKQYYKEAIYNIGNRGTLFDTISDNQNTAVNELESKRQEIMGVASEEELTNMIKFQSAYNASSRFINVIDQMLELLVTGLGN